MAMIENHYYVNVALEGRHFARIELPRGMMEAEAQARASMLHEMFLTFNSLAKWQLDLTRVECGGRSVDFKRTLTEQEWDELCEGEIDEVDGSFIPC